MKKPMLPMSAASDSMPLSTVVEYLESIPYMYERSTDECGETIVVWIDTDGLYCQQWEWMEEQHTLLLTCTFQQAVPEHLLPEAYELARLINQDLCVGQFLVLHEADIITFRHGMFMSGLSCTATWCKEAAETALAVCEDHRVCFEKVAQGVCAADAYKAAGVDEDASQPDWAQQTLGSA